jgi:hypothetical protein
VTTKLSSHEAGRSLLLFKTSQICWASSLVELIDDLSLDVTRQSEVALDVLDHELRFIEFFGDIGELLENTLDLFVLSHDHPTVLDPAAIQQFSDERLMPV